MLNDLRELMCAKIIKIKSEEGIRNHWWWLKISYMYIYVLGTLVVVPYLCLAVETLK